ncbi:NAD(P)/FAD-dependent oxidoreductase [Paenibacillus sp. OV219]|uniref:phytoene desaturase family protein n=1 Tax=Paenibacillus sp. OV219 TaxID=1884377 RepID=UPI0008D74CCD|nr:FAD-dependent oxidoreductase [Paenibacillus sp. OV219]SEM51229.1 Phytoene dehydrogenase-related protein [Paenibacillus sp. OV219]
MQMAHYDTAVIGGGLAGLLAALELAKKGRSVIVIEKSSRLGGRAMTNTQHGIQLNMGGHALYKTGRAYEILQEHGISLEGGPPSTKTNVIWNKKLYSLSPDPISMLTSKLLTLSGKINLMRLMLKLSKLDAQRLPVTMSIREWAEAEVTDPKVRHVFYALCRTATYTLDPDFQLAAPALAQVQRSLKGGVLYVNGGWQTIIEQLRQKAQQAGAHIVSGKSIREIQHANGRVQRLVFADGEELAVSNVISTASPSESAKLVQGAEATALQRWKTEARPVTAACMDLGLRKLPIKGRHLALGLDQPVFFSEHSVSAKLSDNGEVVVHLIKYNSLGTSDPKADEKLLRETMSMLHPGWEQEVIAKQFLPNITVVHDYPHRGKKKTAVGPEVPEIQGLYVAGDWVSHGELLADASAASARRAAEAIVSKHA